MKLALNGINLGALMHAGEEPKEATRDIGDRTEATDGSTRVTRAARKNDLAFSSVPLTGADAHAWKCLLTGEGEAWSFDSSLYGSKGTGPSAAVNTSQSAGAAKYGAGKLEVGATTGTITYSSVTLNGWGGSTAWTVMVWRYEGAAWVHYVVRSDGAKWVDGARNDAASTTWLTVGSDVTIANATGSPVLYDELVVLPFAVPANWPAQVVAAAVAYGALPFLLATGDLVAEKAAREVCGEVEESSFMRAAAGVRKTLRVKLVAR